ncbi:MAG: hypothetical protein ACOH2R_08500 [Pseudomonas sp.]
MRITTFLSVAFALALSCGYAVASPDPQNFTYLTFDHGCGHAQDVAAVHASHQIALTAWQRAVAVESSSRRSDMHVSSNGLVFASVQPEPYNDGQLSA